MCACICGPHSCVRVYAGLMRVHVGLTRWVCGPDTNILENAGSVVHPKPVDL